MPKYIFITIFVITVRESKLQRLLRYFVRSGKDIYIKYIYPSGLQPARVYGFT